MRNNLPAALSPPDFTLLTPHLQAASLPRHRRIERPNRRTDFVYFPESGLVAVGELRAEIIQLDRLALTKIE